MNGVSILKLIIGLLKGKKATVICCEKCGSPFVEFGEVTKYNKEKEYIRIKYPVECCDCGAKGVITERWWV